jgi:hypothetical protein
VERIVSNARPGIEARRLLELESTVKVPPTVFQQAVTMGQEIVTLRLPLGPVASIVGADGPDWPAHSNNGAHPNEQSLKPFRTLKTSVYQASMETNGMACAQRKCCEHEKYKKCTPGEIKGGKQQCR